MPSQTELVFLEQAVSDLEEITKYLILEEGETSARNICSAIRTRIERLSNFPLMGQTHPDPMLASQGYRKLILTGTYVAVYKVIDGTVCILRIVNGRTDYPALLK